MENNQGKVVKCYILLPSTEVSRVQFIFPEAAFRQLAIKALLSPPFGSLSRQISRNHKLTWTPSDKAAEAQ